MLWIVSAGIDGSIVERKARLQFIKDVSGDYRVNWEKRTLPFVCDFFMCETDDGINGAFFTAHNYEVYYFCCCPWIANKDFVVANTCIIQKADKKILQAMRGINDKAKLFFAKQTLEILNGIKLIYTNSIDEVGNFGFLTSKSERILYRNRKKGIWEAVQNAFNLVTLED